MTQLDGRDVGHWHVREHLNRLEGCEWGPWIRGCTVLGNCRLSEMGCLVFISCSGSLATACGQLRAPHDRNTVSLGFK